MFINRRILQPETRVYVHLETSSLITRSFNMFRCPKNVDSSNHKEFVSVLWTVVFAAIAFCGVLYLVAIFAPRYFSVFLAPIFFSVSINDVCTYAYGSAKGVQIGLL